MRQRSALALALALALAVGLAHALAAVGSVAAAAEAPVRRLLFVGNSFTYGNDLPGMVVRLAVSAEPPVRYRAGMIARGGWFLGDHVAAGRVGRELGRGGWDVIVIQGHSTELLPDRAAAFRPARDALLALAARAGVRACLLAPWPPGLLAAEDRPDFAARTEAAYREAGACVIPVGRLWTEREAAGGRLRATDGHHATPAGTYLAALAVLAALGDADPRATRWVPPGLDPGEAARLRTLAATTRAPRRGAPTSAPPRACAPHGPALYRRRHRTPLTGP